MVNNLTVSTCPLFPELESVNTVSSGVYTIPDGTVVPGYGAAMVTVPWSAGSGISSTEYNVSYNGWSSTALRNYEFELHEKYPALRQAWEHYQNVLKMCRSREEEEDAN